MRLPTGQSGKQWSTSIPAFTPNLVRKDCRGILLSFPLRHSSGIGSDDFPERVFGRGSQFFLEGRCGLDGSGSRYSHTAPRANQSEKSSGFLRLYERAQRGRRWPSWKNVVHAPSLCRGSHLRHPRNSHPSHLKSSPGLTHIHPA